MWKKVKKIRNIFWKKTRNMRREKNNPVEKRETLQEYEYRLKQLAKSSLQELKKIKNQPILSIKKDLS